MEIDFSLNGRIENLRSINFGIATARVLNSRQKTYT